MDDFDENFDEYIYGLLSGFNNKYFLFSSLTISFLNVISFSINIFNSDGTSYFCICLSK